MKTWTQGRGPNAHPGASARTAPKLPSRRFVVEWKTDAERITPQAHAKIKDAEAECDELTANMHGERYVIVEYAPISPKLRAALKRVALFSRQFKRKPLPHQPDAFYAIHTGTEFEAELRLSDLHEIAKLIP